MKTKVAKSPLTTATRTIAGSVLVTKSTIANQYSVRGISSTTYLHTYRRAARPERAKRSGRPVHLHDLESPLTER